MGVRAIPIVADVADSQLVEEIVDTVIKEMGRIDILLSNAGYHESCPLEEMTDEQWHRMINVHLDGTFYCCRAVVPVMKRQGKGKIIFYLLGYAHGRLGQRRCTLCCGQGRNAGAKQTLAKDLAPYKINVNAIAPGSTMTALTLNYPKELVTNEGKSMGALWRPAGSWLPCFVSCFRGRRLHYWSNH